MRDIRMAAVIFHSPLGRAAEALSRMAVWIERAKKEKVEIICFPEMNITGYSTKKEVAGSAEKLPGSISEKLIQMAARADMVVLAGMAEKNENGQLFASHLVVKPDRSVAAYRKLYLAPPEKSLFTPAGDVPVFNARGLRFGIQLCYDAHFPELSTHMAEKGVDLVFMPHASPRGTSDEKYRSWQRHLPARAYDNGIFVMAVNQTGDNGAGLVFPGVGMAIGPSGNVMAKDLSGEEGLLVVDFKAEDLTRVRHHRMRYFLPNRRSGLYSKMGV